MKATLQQAWQTQNGLARWLWPVSLLYGLAVGVRRRLYKAGLFSSTRVGVPVIVVGNLVAGGGGKTPLVIALVTHLQQRGIRAGVISRGYGRTAQSCQEVHLQTPVLESGDEPALIKRATGAPVFVASKRAEAAVALLRAHPSTHLIICDDGLQHHALASDIRIAVFDDRGVGNGWLLPAGPLREPWPVKEHAGVDLILHTGRTPAFKGFSSTRRLADNAVGADGSTVDLRDLSGQPLVALAAIATPDAFFSMLVDAGLTLAQTIPLPDHHDFSGYELPVKAGSTVLCTEKDAVKLFQLQVTTSIRLLAVPLVFTPEPAFIEALDALLAPLLSHLPSSHGH
ncbi:MAG: tetraacyldisaccharide 4'-kinase [Polaromonas sp.]